MMNVFKLKALLISFFLLLSSCSHFYEPSYYSSGRKISSVEEERLSYLLAVDRFSYYIQEFLQFQEGKVDESVIHALKEIKAETILDHGFSYSKLGTAANYDDMIHEMLKTYSPKVKFDKSTLVWNYNFFKNKLNEAYVVAPARLNELGIDREVISGMEPSEVLELSKLLESDMTLDSGHYISNRTSRGVFWEAIEAGRTFEFHLGEARDFVNNLTQNQGEIVAEIKPLARNYNKIYLVQYPGEEQARLAISNIGGMDRLQHLVKHIELSNLSGGKLANKIEIFGSPEAMEARMEAELIQKFKLLGKADRVIIGQKGAIDSTLNVMWKLEALRNLHSAFPDKITGTDKEVKEVLLALDSNPKEFDLFKVNKSIENVFEKHKAFLEANPKILPPSLKVSEFGNSVAEFTDYVFQNGDGKSIRWRIVSNMWGDEIVPIAKALKATGHKNITYAGTAGAYPGRGYQVGDLVIPDAVFKGDNKYEFRGKTLGITQYKGGGTVEHVGSPFEETHEWLERTAKRSDFVEIETSYLGRTFNAEDDHVRVYLLISDILGSEGETLANASSSKRRNSLNRYISSIFERDNAVRLKPVAQSTSSLLEKIRKIVNEAIPKKAATFKHYVIAHYLNTSTVPTVKDVLEFEKGAAVFTDNSFSKRVSGISYEISKALNKISEDQALPTINVDKSFVQGTWNAKSDPLNVVLGVADKNTLKKVEEVLASQSFPKALNVKVTAALGEVQEGMASYRPAYQNNLDHLIEVYKRAALDKTGLDVGYGATANFRFSELPTKESVDPCGVSHCNLAYYAPDSATEKALKEAKAFPLEKANQLLDKAINDGNSFTKGSTYGEIRTSFRKQIVDSLPSGNLAEIVPEFNKENNAVDIVVKITKAAQNNPMVLLEEAGHLQQMYGGAFFGHPLYWTEIALNAEYGSKRSQLLLAEAELDVVSRVRALMQGQTDGFDSYFTARAAHAERIIAGVKAELKKENKARKAINNSFKVVMGELEKREIKLDQLIAANNRKGVVELIENFMPWEDLEPVEIATWRSWLESMKTPAKNAKDKNLLFRGLGDDLVRKGNNGGHFLMSTMLTKNQGNYTRRLRSLVTYHDKLMKQVKNNDDIDANLRSLYVAMVGHSHVPEGSPYLSLSNLQVANAFSGSGGGRTAAIYLDQNRFMPNIYSGYGEEERLVPLIVFPDEVIAVKETGVTEKQFFADIKSVIGRDLYQSELSESGLDRHASMKMWWDAINPSGMTAGGNGKRCEEAIKLFLAK